MVRLIAVTGLVLLAAGTAMAGPLMEVSTSVIDFGYVPEHIDVSYVMWLYSRGDTAVTIYRFEPDCPCIKSDFTGPQILQPGDSLPVTVRFNSHRFIKRVSKTPTIHNNQGLGSHKIRVEAYVAVDPAENRPLVVKPYAMDISPIGDNVRDSMSFQLVNESDEPVRPRLNYTPPEVERVELPEVVPPGKTAHGRVILKKSVLGTEFLKSFTIEVDDKEKTHYTVPIKRRIRQ